jgi:hypothetical protein
VKRVVLINEKDTCVSSAVLHPLALCTVSLVHT